MTALLDPTVGEAAVYVQGASLKTVAAFLPRLSNSPITRGSEASVLAPEGAAS